MRELEHCFPNELVVIGVRSAKYTAEGRDIHLDQAIRRLEIDHPVVNDREMRVWSEYSVRAWPTLMFVSPEGRVVGKHEGEFPLKTMVAAIDEMLARYRDDGCLDTSPFPQVDVAEAPDSVLAFPTAIEIDAASDRIFIADTNHHRVLVTDTSGNVLQVIGSGRPGHLDAAMDEARFRRPHGLALDRGRLLVADTENHAIRQVDLSAGHVSTIAGTGSKADSYVSGGPARETSLRSPWDVAIHDGVLYISMAGSHQLWFHRPGSNEVRRFAGTGHEGKRDGTIPSAWLAQPSGIAPFGNQLVFADAETSSVRTTDLLGSDGEVRTVVGKDLFDWGDQPGALDQALLQHATGVAPDIERQLVYVSDTYNNKIKRIDLSASLIQDVAGSGEPGFAAGVGRNARFFEPHGLTLAGETLYVTDTNNHAIRTIHLPTREVSTLTVTGQ